MLLRTTLAWQLRQLHHAHLCCKGSLMKIRRTCMLWAATVSASAACTDRKHVQWWHAIPTVPSPHEEHPLGSSCGGSSFPRPVRSPCPAETVASCLNKRCVCCVPYNLRVPAPFMWGNPEGQEAKHGSVQARHPHTQTADADQSRPVHAYEGMRKRKQERATGDEEVEEEICDRGALAISLSRRYGLHLLLLRSTPMLKTHRSYDNISSETCKICHGVAH